MLVEMVAALALTGLLLAFALPLVPRGTGSAGFGSLVVSAAALLRDARSEAIAHGRSVAAGFDARARQLRAGSHLLTVPRDVDVSLLAGGNCPTNDSTTTRLVFRADGTNCGGVFRFAGRGHVLRLRVDWADGRIDVVPDKD